MIIEPDGVILFTGDSITDGGRDRKNGAHHHQSISCPACLGHGYVQMIAKKLEAQFPATKMRIFNRGLSGDRIYDLETRMEADLLALKPTLISILIGINDTWRRFDQGLESPPERFATSYRRILEQAQRKLSARIIVIEPFLLPATSGQLAWRKDVDARIKITRAVAAEFAAIYLPLDEMLGEESHQIPATELVPDGVHPSAVGHQFIASAWLQSVQTA